METRSSFVERVLFCPEHADKHVFTERAARARIERFNVPPTHSGHFAGTLTATVSIYMYFIEKKGRAQWLQDLFTVFYFVLVYLYNYKCHY